MRALRLFKTDVALLTALCDLGRRLAGDDRHAPPVGGRRRGGGGGRGLPLPPGARKGRLASATSPTATSCSAWASTAPSSSTTPPTSISSSSTTSTRVRLRAGLEVQPFFVRLTRDLVRLLHERTGDGYVFRTDLRLRPDPGATPLAISTDAALNYYESVGQNWERAALIKARPVAGDLAAGQALLEDLAPFIWRKYLDFAAIADIHAMKRQIHAFRGFGSIGVAGHNIKVGRGGIREIEFFVQTQQLIAGGRQPELRVSRDAGRIAAAGGARAGSPPACAHELGAGLPLPAHGRASPADDRRRADPDAARRIPTSSLGLARFCGFADTAAFALAPDGRAGARAGPLRSPVRAQPRADARRRQHGVCRRGRRSRHRRGAHRHGLHARLPRSSPWCAAGITGATRPCARPVPASC